MLGSGFNNYGAYTGYPFIDEYIRRNHAPDRYVEGAEQAAVPPLRAIQDAMIDFAGIQPAEVKLRAIGYSSAGWTSISLSTSEDYHQQEYIIEFPDSEISTHGTTGLYADKLYGEFNLVVALLVSYDLKLWVDNVMTTAGIPYWGSPHDSGESGEPEPDFTLVELPGGGMPFYPSVHGSGTPRVTAFLVPHKEQVIIETSGDESGESPGLETLEVETLKRVTGNVSFVPGYNISMELNNLQLGKPAPPFALDMHSQLPPGRDALHSIRMSAHAGAGVGTVPCSEQGRDRAGGTGIRRPGNLRPSATGILNLAGDSCMRVRPALPSDEQVSAHLRQSTLVIENICEPCCTCAQYVDAAETYTAYMHRLQDARILLDIAFARVRVHGRFPAVHRFEDGSAYAGLSVHQHTRKEGYDTDVERVYYMVVAASAMGKAFTVSVGGGFAVSRSALVLYNTTPSSLNGRVTLLNDPVAGITIGEDVISASAGVRFLELIIAYTDDKPGLHITVDPYGESDPYTFEAEDYTDA